MLFAIVGGGLILFGVLALYAGHAEQLRLKSLPEVRCGDDVGPDQEVKVTGKATASSLVIAPLSEKPCVLYTLTLKYASNVAVTGRNRDLHTLTTLRSADDAALEDPTGKLLLHLQEHRLHLGNTTTAAAGAFSSVKAEKLANDLLPSSHYFPRALYERRLDAGDTALVIGRIQDSAAGRIIGGESRLELFGGGEKGHAQVNRAADLIALGLIAFGLLLGAAGAFGLLDEPAADKTTPVERMRPLETQQRY